MDCHLAKQRITEGRETAAVRRHLEKCSDCAAFVRELADGGREIARAFLDVEPTIGFEERVAARIAEREISVPVGTAGRLARLLAPALFVLLALAIWRLAVPVEPAATPAPPTASEEAAPVEAAVTEPAVAVPVYVSLWRDREDPGTRVHLSFTGEAEVLPLDGAVEEALLTSWALGARRAEVSVSGEVPGYDLVRLLGLLERAGFAYSLTRTRL